MERFYIFLLLLIFPSGLFAQQYTEYNRKGDEAMAKKDYYDARFWYGEGVGNCDMYSIQKLTDIWLENESMRPSMRNIMGRCYTCLNVKATEKDTTAINLMIVFFKEGIGTSQSNEMASYWEEQKKMLETPVTLPPVYPVDQSSSSRNPMKFFVGYAFSTEMPYGITFGGMQNKWGWYTRLKTNFSFFNSENSLECFVNEKGNTEIDGNIDGKSYQVDDSKSSKKNSMAGTVGLIYQATSILNFSVGAGYGQRTLFTPFTSRDHSETSRTDNTWIKNRDYSYKGIMVEADAMMRFDKFFLSVGCHTMNFKYIDINAGIGLFF